MVYIFKKYEPSMTILPSCLTMSKHDMLTDFAQPMAVGATSVGLNMSSQVIINRNVLTSGKPPHLIGSQDSRAVFMHRLTQSWSSLKCARVVHSK